MIDIDALRRDKRPQSAWVVHALIDRLEAAEKERDVLKAKIEQMDAAFESLLIRCDDSDSEMYGTLSTSFVRDIARIARGT